MEQKKQYAKDVGCIWIKESSYGEYLSIQVEINGAKHNFAAFKNRFYEPGSKKPFYTIPAPKIQSNDTNQINKHQSNIDFVNAEKAKQAARNAKLATIAQIEPQLDFTEEQMPF